MPEIDLTITISVIVALCAIVSPIFTAIINNAHHTKIKKMELRQQRYIETTLHIRELFESYLNYTARYLNHPDSKTFTEYGEHYYSALVYAPSDLRKDMISVNQFIDKNDFTNASKVLETLTPKIHTILQNK